MGEGEYIGECSDDKSIYNNQGIFFGIFCFNAVVGNLFGLCLLQNGLLRVAMYAIMTAFALVSVMLFFCTRFSGHGRSAGAG